LKQFEIPQLEDASLAEAVDARWNSLTKPRGSLGRLETLVKAFALQRGNDRPTLARRGMYVFCGDHGVTEEGVSAYPSEVTRQMVLNFVAGGAAINVLCRQLFIRSVIVDAGVKGEPVPGAMDCRIGAGTKNFVKEPAMTRDDAVRAIEWGAQLATFAGDEICGVGEMGIGNTTAASALLCVLGGVTPAEAVGPGTGLNEEGVRRKAKVIAGALAFHKPDASDPVAVLAALGGFEIAMMTGFLLGAAESRMPVMMDGFISCAAALVARAIEPRVMGYLHFSHQSAEPGHARMLSALGVEPLLTLSMRLGEGSGAALGINLLSQALALYDNMATFEQAAVSDSR
jgi:nicotinate-nucleotide--dimethylbenzimidazole phosphoribosyltransferase